MAIRVRATAAARVHGLDIQGVIAIQRDPHYLRYAESWTERSDSAIGDFVRTLIDYQSLRPRRKFHFALALPGSGR